MTAQTTLDLDEGRRRLKKVLETHEQATGYLTDEIDRRLVARIPDGGTTTVDEAHVILEEILAEDVELGFPARKLEDRRFLANVFCHKRHWVKVGYRQTRRPERNGAVVALWRLDESKLEADDG